MKTYSNKMVGWLVKSKVIDSTEIELYTYAIESFVLLILPFVLAASIGAATGNVVSGMLVILPFMFLRKYSGGYHAGSIWICLLESTAVLAVSIIYAQKSSLNGMFIAITILFITCIILCSPVDRDIDKRERKYIRKRIYVILATISAITVALILGGQESLARYIMVGIQLTGALQVPCIIMKKV